MENGISRLADTETFLSCLTAALYRLRFNEKLSEKEKKDELADIHVGVHAYLNYTSMLKQKQESVAFEPRKPAPDGSQPLVPKDHVRFSMHPHKKVVCPWKDEEIVQIDSAIAKLIELLWALGCKTSFSCESDSTEPRMAYILFYSSNDADLMIEAITVHGDSVIKEQMRSQYGKRPETMDEFWQISCNRWEWSARPIENSYKDDEKPGLAIGVAFPKDYIKQIEEALQKAVDNAKKPSEE